MSNVPLKECNKCDNRKALEHFRIRKDNSKLRNTCRTCENLLQQKKSIAIVRIITKSKTPPPSDVISKRMLGGANRRAMEKGLPFNLDLTDVQIPAICPVLRIPLVPSVDGFLHENSPTLDRQLPHLGYTKGNVQVISNMANRIKTNANSIQLEAVLKYVKSIEDKHK